MAEVEELPGFKYLTINLGFTGIVVLVGEGKCQQSFLVHKTLITSRSKFFARELSMPWRDAEDNMVKLPSDEPKIFALYLHLLYTGKLPLKGKCKAKCAENELDAWSENDSSSSYKDSDDNSHDSDDNSSSYKDSDDNSHDSDDNSHDSDDNSHDSDDNSHDSSDTSNHDTSNYDISNDEINDIRKSDGGTTVSEKIHDNDRRNHNKSCGLDFTPLSKLFVLSEILQDEVAKNSVIDAFSEESQKACGSHSHMPSSSEIWIIYNGTPESSLLRKLVVDIYIQCMTDMNSKYADFPKHFIFDVMVGMSHRMAWPLVEGELDGSRYHTEVGVEKQEFLGHSSSSQTDMN